MPTLSRKTLRFWFDSPSLRRLNDATKAKCVDTLHLNARAVHILEKREIYTVGDLVRSASDGLELSITPGTRSLAEIDDSLRALSECVEVDGTPTWESYAARRGFVILPPPPLPKDLVAFFPETLRSAINLCYGAEDLKIFDKYLMHIRSVKAGSLTRELQLTRQGISFLKQRSLRALRAAILSDRYMGMRFRFAEAFVMPLRELKREMAGRATLGFTETEVLVRKVTESDLSSSEPGRDLLLEILGYAIYNPFGAGAAPVILHKRQLKGAVDRAVKRTQKLLRSSVPEGLTKREIFAKLRGEGETKQTVAAVAALLDSFPGVESPGRGLFRATFENLTRTPDQIERILKETLRPMSAKELSTQITLRGGGLWSPRNVGQMLVSDARFKSIGSTGVWTLVEWCLECGTVADVAARILQQSGAPLTEEQLFSFVGKHRPVKLGSIRSLLREDGRFRRVAPSTWELL